MKTTSNRRIRPRFIAPLLAGVLAASGACAPGEDEPDHEPSDVDDDALTMSGTLAATRIVWSGARGEEIRFTLQTQAEDVPLKLAATVTDMRGLPTRMRPGMQVSLRGRMESGSLIVDTVEAATDSAALPASGRVLHTPTLFEEDRKAPPWTDPFEIGDLAEAAVEHVNTTIASGQLSLKSVGAFPQGLGQTLQQSYLGRSKACDLDAILGAAASFEVPEAEVGPATGDVRHWSIYYPAACSEAGSEMVEASSIGPRLVRGIHGTTAPRRMSVSWIPVKGPLFDGTTLAAAGRRAQALAARGIARGLGADDGSSRTCSFTLGTFPEDDPHSCAEKPGGDPWSLVSATGLSALQGSPGSLALPDLPVSSKRALGISIASTEAELAKLPIAGSGTSFPLSVGQGGIQELRIARDTHGSAGRSGLGCYSFSRQAPHAGAPGNLASGIVVRLTQDCSSKSLANANPWLVDSHPQTPSFTDAALDPGQEVDDFEGLISYRHTSAGTLALKRIGTHVGVNAASFLPGESVPRIAPNELIAAFGELGGASKVVITTPAGEVEATQVVPLGDQVNFLVPPNVPLSGGGAQVRIYTTSGKLVERGVTIAPVAPGLFAANGSGSGAALGQLYRTPKGGSLEVVSLATPNGDAAPLAIGPDDQAILVLYGTGFQNAGTASVRVDIDGVPGEVAYAGAQGDYPGLDQLNVVVPVEVRGRGRVAVQLQAEGQSSNPLVVDLRRLDGTFEPAIDDAGAAAIELEYEQNLATAIQAAAICRSNAAACQPGLFEPTMSILGVEEALATSGAEEASAVAVDLSLCNVLKRQERNAHRYYVKGAYGLVAPGSPALPNGQGGIDYVLDVWNRQAAAFLFAGIGVSPSVVEVGGYAAEAIGNKPDVISAWSGTFRSAGVSVNLPFELASAGVTGFVSPDGTVAGVAFSLSAGISVNPYPVSGALADAFWVPNDTVTSTMTISGSSFKTAKATGFDGKEGNFKLVQYNSLRQFQAGLALYGPPIPSFQARYQAETLAIDLLKRGLARCKR